jgi:Fe-S-cluster containining protein
LDSLQNYRQLLSRIDDLCRRSEERYAGHIACRKGCDECCRHLSLFWVEGAALALALQSLPEEQRAHLRKKARDSRPDGPCPLLENGVCLLYRARPIICRTHGLPVLTGDGQVDFCPRNFVGLAALPGDAVLDLERLNTALAGVNALFVAEIFAAHPPVKERLSIAEALLLDLC